MSALASRVQKRKLTKFELDAQKFASAADRTADFGGEDDKSAIVVPKIKTLESLAVAVDEDYPLAHVPNSTKAFSKGDCVDKAKTFMKHKHEAYQINDLLRELKMDDLSLHKARELVASLRGNQKLVFNLDNTVSYKPVFAVKDIGGLETLIREFHEDGKGGISSKDLADSYATVDHDIVELKKRNAIMVVNMMRGKKVVDEVIFYRDPNGTLEKPIPDPDFIKLWSEVAVKSPAEIENNLKQGKKPVMRKALPPPTEGRKRKRNKAASGPAAKKAG